MKVLRTTVIKDDNGCLVSENTLGQMEISFSETRPSGKTKYNAQKQRTVVSANLNVTSDKTRLTKAIAAKITYGWETAVVEWNEQDIKNLIVNYGFSISTYTDGHRCNDSVLAYNSLMLDFDKYDKTLDLLKQDFRNFQGDYCIFSSTNHTPAKPKLRVWIPLSRTISETELEIFKQSFLKRYPTIDPTCFDRSRFWYFTPASDFFFTNAMGFLDVDAQIARLIKEDPKLEEVLKGSVKGNNQSRSVTKERSNKGTWTFSLDTELLKADGSKIQVSEIKGHTRIFCPQCGKSPERGNPNTDNAFIEKSGSGFYFIYCSSEATTYWQDKASLLSVKFTESNNAYYKSVKTGQEFTNVMVTSFIIKPKELLVLDNSDCLKCDIHSMLGYNYKDVLIENTDWHSKQKFLKALGHQDCVFLGSDNDLQALCQFIQVGVSVRKKGTKVIGLHEDTWVTEGMNITKNGLSEDIRIVPYDKGSDAFYHKIKYRDLSSGEYEDMLKVFYENILNVNERNKILAYLGWLFATPVKPRIEKLTGSFPLLFQHGSHGSGKTSLSKVFAKFIGYTDPTPNSVTLKNFPMLKMLSSTNAIAQWYDEYKITDMKEAEIDNIHRFMRKAYAGEIESKGRADQTVENYKLSAPMVVMGEWNINQPAILERVILIRTSDIIKKDRAMQESFNRIKDLPLDGFMPRYIQYCLNQDIDEMMKRSKQYVTSHFSSVTVAPRIINNMTVMIMGLELLKGFADYNHIPVRDINYGELLDDQLEEITGSKGGMVRSAVDQLLEELAIMADKKELNQYGNYKIVETKSGVKLLAIRFREVFRDFKVYAKKTNYEGESLDEYSYIKMFDSCSYVYDKNYVVKFEDGKTKKCLAIDIQKAFSSGICLDGFVNDSDRPVTPGYSGLQTEGNSESSLFK